MLHETFDFDGRAARTLRVLFRRPGHLTAEFLAGKRRRYTPPFRLYLVISIVFFVIVGWLAGRGLLVEEGMPGHDDLDAQVRLFSDDLPKLMFVMLPAFALFLKLAWHRRFYFEHLIHALHLHSAVYVLLALMLPLEQAASRHWLLLVLQLVLFAWLIGYCFLSVRRVYPETGPAAAAAKTAGVLFGYMALLALALEGVSHMGSTGLPFFTD